MRFTPDNQRAGRRLRSLLLAMLSLLAVIVVGTTAPSQAHASSYAQTNALNRPIFTKLLLLDSQNTYEFKVSNFTVGSTPVIRLYHLGSSSVVSAQRNDGHYKSMTEVGFAASWLGRNAVLTVDSSDFPSGVGQSNYILVVHAYGEYDVGTGSLTMNGQSLGTIWFGGHTEFQPTQPDDPAVQFRTVLEPLDANRHQMVVAVGPASEGFGWHGRLYTNAREGVWWDSPFSSSNPNPYGGSALFATITSDRARSRKGGQHDENGYGAVARSINSSKRPNLS